MLCYYLYIRFSFLRATNRVFFTFRASEWPYRGVELLRFWIVIKPNIRQYFDMIVLCALTTCYLFGVRKSRPKGVRWVENKFADATTNKLTKLCRNVLFVQAQSGVYPGILQGIVWQSLKTDIHQRCAENAAIKKFVRNLAAIVCSSRCEHVSGSRVSSNKCDPQHVHISPYLFICSSVNSILKF